MRCWITLAFAILGIALPATGQSIRVKEVLTELDFAKGSERKVLAGQLVKTTVKPTSDRELNAGLAFLVKVSPEKLIEKLRGGLLLSLDPNSKLHGALEGEGSGAQLAALELSPSQVEAYSSAKAGEDMNLSQAEIEAFQALLGDPAAQVQGLVRNSLLARYASYRAKGLDGIAPYARGAGREMPAAEDLRRASEAARALKKHTPAFYEVLNEYPKGKTQVTEIFHWQRYAADGEPVLILTHAFSMAEGDAIVACQRQFYVSSSYNVEQALVVLFPVVEGTLVVYLNRTFTEQVTGFGGGAKRSIGSRMLASNLEDLFKRLQQEAPR